MTQSDSLTCKRWAASSCTRPDEVGDACRAITADKKFPADDSIARAYLNEIFGDGEIVKRTWSTYVHAKRRDRSMRPPRGWS